MRKFAEDGKLTAYISTSCSLLGCFY